MGSCGFSLAVRNKTGREGPSESLRRFLVEISNMDGAVKSGLPMKLYIQSARQTSNGTRLAGGASLARNAAD